MAEGKYSQPLPFFCFSTRKKVVCISEILSCSQPKATRDEHSRFDCSNGIVHRDLNHIERYSGLIYQALTSKFSYKQVVLACPRSALNSDKSLRISYLREISSHDGSICEFPTSQILHGISCLLWGVILEEDFSNTSRLSASHAGARYLDIE